MATTQTIDVLQSDEETALQAFREQVAKIPGVKLRDAPRAVVCGATGCSNNENLTKILADDLDPRVLCPRHVLDYINEKVVSA